MHSHQEILQQVHYNPETGLFTRASTGLPITSMHNSGYIQVIIDQKFYLAHRLAWFYVTGEWPAHEVDHRNRVRHDNRWDNLREATKLENMQNMSINSNNTSGYRGVTWHKREEKWMARIGVNKKTIQLGYFDTPEEASQAYEAAKKQYHSFNPSHTEEL